MPRPPKVDPGEWNARIGTVEYLGDWANWSWILTLTFRCDVSQGTALEAFRWLLGRLARKLMKSHFKFARVLDRQPDGRWHLHAVIEVPPGLWIAPLDPRWALHFWEKEAPDDFRTGIPGLNRAEHYDRTLGGLGYMFLRHSGHEWNWACTRTGDCKRRAGCAVAKVGWSPP